MGRKILVADDEPAAAMLVQAILENDGTVEVLAGRDGAEALEIARREKPDIIFLDVRMPKMSGLEVCRLLKRDPETAQIEVVMLTGLDQEADRHQGFKAGADHYLTKPFSPVEFLNKFQEILKQPVSPIGER